MVCLPGGVSARGCLPRGLSAQGGVCPGVSARHHPCEQNHRLLWKHYLAVTTFWTVKIHLPLMFEFCQSPKCLWYLFSHPATIRKFGHAPNNHDHTSRKDHKELLISRHILNLNQGCLVYHENQLRLHWPCAMKDAALSKEIAQCT